MTSKEQQAVTAIRTLAIDAVTKANSGHPGVALGAAPTAYALWRQMKHNPANAKWNARDRFVLSCGHASALEYSLLHFFGFGVTIEDMKQFRQWGGITPGHPEHGLTPGVEMTTGPLGQGFASAVGMAMAEAHMAARFNKDGFPVVDNYTYVLMGDGCMMEGVSSEAASVAGSFGLGKLIALYDSNNITIEGCTDMTFCEDVGARFAAYGWQVLRVGDGEDIEAVESALAQAKAETGKPSLIIVRTEIGYKSPVAGMAKAHGEALSAEDVLKTKAALGWPYTEPFEIPSEVYAHFEELKKGFAEKEKEWNALFAAYEKAYPEDARAYRLWHAEKLPFDLENDADFWKFEKKMATRSASGELLNRLAARMENFIGGSADLAPSVKSTLKDKGQFGIDNYAGRNIPFGVREFAMAAISNGISLYGGLYAYCATFFTFMDYLKPALRLCALMGLPVLYIFTHDSIGVGEDGPTHQPVEHLVSARAIPNNIVFRPADARETAAGYVTWLNAKGPTCLVLSRQDLPLLENSGPAALKGGYVLRDAKGKPDVILMGSGSEVELCVKAADILEAEGVKARVVSMPSFELFQAQDEAYRKSVLPAQITARVAVEAGSSYSWHKYVGLEGRIVGIDHFGASAPAKVLFEKFGFTAENVVAAAKSALKRS
ncbi:MAG: transketolase [Bacillota bacterium]